MYKTRAVWYDDDRMIMYHGTAIENVADIMREGLLPNTASNTNTIPTTTRGTIMMSNFDRWLTTDRRDDDQAAFERWCDANEVEYDADDAWEQFEAAMDDAEQDWAEARAEDAMERALLGE